MSQPLPSRPLTIRMVQWGVGLLVLWNLGRAVALWLQADLLTDLPMTPDPGLRQSLALVWAALLFAVAVGLRWRRSWSRPLIPILLAFYGVYELGIMFAFATTPLTPLTILAYAACVGLVAWALWRPAAGRFFQSR